jgi:hypothetical protein
MYKFCRVTGKKIRFPIHIIFSSSRASIGGGEVFASVVNGNNIGTVPEETKYIGQVEKLYIKKGDSGNL